MQRVIKPRYLIIGASGFVGSSLYSRLGCNAAIATYCKNPIRGGIYFDARSMRLRDTFLRGNHGLTHAFLLCGITKIDACARDPEGTARVNVQSMKEMIDDLLTEGVTPIFASSDAVFDGTRGLWREEDLPNPILTYGRQKVEVESYLMRVKPAWAIARLSKVVGSAEDVLVGSWIKNLEHGETVFCAHDQIFSPACVDDVVTAIIRLAEENCTGLFNICGPRPLSRLELLNILVREIQQYVPLNPNIVPCSLKDLPFLETRPMNTSLIGEKLYSSIGMRFQDMETVCKKIVKERYRNTRGCEGVTVS
ncbi:MAG: sugar nucleotide-binding protein [Nitrospirota bacterium]